METEDIVKYVKTTPWNTNMSILKQLIKYKTTNVDKQKRLLSFVNMNRQSMNLTVFEDYLNIMSDPKGLAPGLYEDGAIELYEAGSIEAAQSKLKVSWEDLEANNVIGISQGSELPENLELNEYGFYYNVPYTTEMSVDIIEHSKTYMQFIFYENGFGLLNMGGYYIEEFPVMYADHSIKISEIADCSITTNGNSVLIKLLQSDEGTVFEAKLGDGTPQKGTVYLGDAQAISKLEGELVLPNNDSITGIDNGCFMNQYYLTAITIPRGVTKISEGAFTGCGDLLSVILPEGITSIEYGAFAHCRKLKNMVIPSTITFIGAYAFLSCVDLSLLVFDGTVEQWNSIQKGKNWNHDSAMIVQCVDGYA